MIDKLITNFGLIVNGSIVALGILLILASFIIKRKDSKSIVSKIFLIIGVVIVILFLILFVVMFVLANVWGRI